MDNDELIQLEITFPWFVARYRVPRSCGFQVLSKFTYLNDRWWRRWFGAALLLLNTEEEKAQALSFRQAIAVRIIEIPKDPPVQESDR